MADNPKVLQAANLVKLGMARELKECLAACSPESVNNRDDQGRSFLHHAAAFGFEECIDVLLESPGIDVGAADEKGLLPLHYAAVHAQPMCAYNLAKAAPETCLQKDGAGQTPADAAAECDKGEVLNAMLLACASISSAEAVTSMARLLQAGAVPDTWAPNGSSALMLAASVDCTEGLSLLIEHGATIELQDALGRTALMFAAGSSAGDAVKVLLDAGASLAARDRRNKGILDYAGDDTPVRTLLEERMSVLEAAAEKLQAALLASLEDEKPEGTQQQAKAKRKKEKKSRRTKKTAAQSEPLKQASSQAEPCTPSPDNSASEHVSTQSDDDDAACQEQGRNTSDAARRDDLANSAAEASGPNESAPGASADTDGRHACSSSGEQESIHTPALGLAGETTSEDEWKVVGKAARKMAPKTPAALTSAAPSGPQQHKRSQQPNQKACKRCPSLASLTESSGTAESAESDHSVLSAITVHPSGAHHKPLTPAARHRVAPAGSINTAHQHMPGSRSDTPPEQHAQSAASTSSAPAQSWAGRVAGGGLACQQQNGRKHTSGSAMSSPSTPGSLGAGSSSHMYNGQQSHAGGTLSGSTEHCLSSGMVMYSTCSSAAKPQQAGIPTIPEEGVASILHCSSHDNSYAALGDAVHRATGQSCCAAARAQSEASAAEAVAAKQEASTLRAELQLLRAAMQRTKTAHQQEIAQLLQSAACHQAQLVREAVQAEKDAMAERLLHTFQSMKGLMHARPLDQRCDDASTDIMASLLTPQPVGEAAALLGLSSALQPTSSAAAASGYTAFVGDAGHQVYHDDAAAATLGASLSGLVSGLSISSPFLIEAHSAPVLPPAAAYAAANGSKKTESFSFFST